MNFVKKIISAITKVTVNNKTYDINSNSTIIIRGGQVIINGIDCTPDMKNINITIAGDIDNLEIGACNKLEVIGNVNKLTTSSGDIIVTGSSGPIQTSSGDVEVRQNVTGNVNTTSGDVTAKSIGGSVKTVSGDVNL